MKSLDEILSPYIFILGSNIYLKLMSILSNKIVTFQAECG